MHYLYTPSLKVKQNINTYTTLILFLIIILCYSINTLTFCALVLNAGHPSQIGVILVDLSGLAV